EKIIAIPFEDPSYNVYRSIEALPAHIFEEMQHFFRVYKQLEGKETAVNEVQGQKAATEVVAQCIENYKNKYGSHKSEEATV
ncbi:MAG: inorganic diphosphatase, partial [Ruminiclostridium sp.]|nr:inorganic diphosphatase [Ruminiclostridium sp.]